MSLVNKILDAMKLDPDDDFEYDNDDIELEEEETQTKVSSFREKKSSDDFDLDDHKKKMERVQKPIQKITPIKSVSKTRQAAPGMEVCVIRPQAIEDERDITDTLLDGRTVVLNVEGLAVDTSQRIIDFVSGSCYALGGNLQKISNYIFIITPANVDISGDFQGYVDGFDANSFRSEF